MLAALNCELFCFTITYFPTLGVAVNRFFWYDIR